MPLFPKIQSPCPYQSQFAAIMDGDMCRMCNRQVFDLTAMDDDGRIAFFAGCKEEVCVSYRLPLHPAIAAAALAASAVGLPSAAAAQEQVITVTAGGIKDPANVRFIEQKADRAIPELPVVYEPSKPASGTAAPGRRSGPRSATVSRPSGS
jgi:hypothetical protein